MNVTEPGIMNKIDDLSKTMNEPDNDSGSGGSREGQNLMTKKGEKPARK